MDSAAKRPRLIYYNDAHHFHGKRVDPPVSKHRLWQPVDELAGTGAEMLAFGLGYGDVFFHDSKVGKSILQTSDVIPNPIDWRIKAMARDAAAMGTDQVREVIGRGKQLGVVVLPSLKMNNAQAPGAHRCGSFREERGEEVCLREPPSEWCYDYTHADVRAYKLALIREMLDDYGADGIELDFLFDARYFRAADIEAGKRIMSDYMAEIRQLGRRGRLRQGPLPDLRCPCLRHRGGEPAQRPRRQDLAERGQPGPRRRGSLRFPVRDDPAACPVACRRRQRQRRGPLHPAGAARVRRAHGLTGRRDVPGFQPQPAVAGLRRDVPGIH